MKQRILFVALVLVVAASSWAQVKVDEVRPLAADGTVTVSNLAGSVQVVGYGGRQVEITGVLGKDVEELEISGSDDRLDIEVKIPHRAKKIESDLVIRVPDTADVEVDTVSASIEIVGMSGSVEAESVSGSVKVADRPRQLSVETVSGSIEVGGGSERSDLASVSGKITVQNAGGELDAETVSGSIRVDGGMLESASFESVSGSIHFAADMSGRGEFDFESMSGSVTLMVSPGISADFEVSTFSGAISNDIGPEAKRTSKYTSEKELSFTAAGGGAEVSIESFSGSVKIKTR
jgi:DUF4097 and DUF4098 domain-containing protein YvlB